MKQILRRWLPGVGSFLTTDHRTAERVLDAARAAEGWETHRIAAAYAELRRGVAAGTPWTEERILVTSMSLTAAAMRRALGVDPYLVQVLAGLAMARGGIAEMQTGEGKTLATAFPAVLFSLAGGGVHVMTVNAYLAERDHALLQPLFRMLGFEAGLLRPGDNLNARQSAYACPVTYGPGYEFGFDYLRDQLAQQQRDVAASDFDDRDALAVALPPPETRQAGHAFAIIDEADSVLIDEAGTPLVISDQPPVPHPFPEPYARACELAAELRAGEDFLLDERLGIRLLPPARRKLQDSVRAASRRWPLQRPWAQYVEQALFARQVLRRDIDYVVEEGEVRIVDKDTGRIFADRSWQAGLHQAVQAKERVTVMAEARCAARIARQRYFRLYRRLCGLTGTAASAARELFEVYGLDVVVIPLRTPSRRVIERTRFFARADQKWYAVVESVRERWQRGQPVLIGTGTIQQSEELARGLAAAHLPFQLLNGKQLAEEAAIIARAGQRGAITVATNMAGRGTDIRLGEGVHALGGLHVVGTQRHESERVDRQLMGRCARQGDPGSCQFFVSAQDPLITAFSPLLARQMHRLAGKDGEIRADLSSQVRAVQAQAERAARLRRKDVALHDDWLTDLIARL